MKKAKFYKHSKHNFISIILENHLFDKDDEFLSKLLELLKLFYRENMTILCSFFSDNNDEFANELIKIFADEITTLFTRKKLFSKAEYCKMQVPLSEVSLNEVVSLAIKHTASPDIEANDSHGTVLFEIGLNDNDGTFINFNTNEFNLDEIKEKVNQILNKKN